MAGDLFELARKLFAWVNEHVCEDVSEREYHVNDIVIRAWQERMPADASLETFRDLCHVAKRLIEKSGIWE